MEEINERRKIMGFEGSKMIFDLQPQSPLIHFQPDEPGATVRASEMKPKLDKFLIKKFKKEEIDYTDWLPKTPENNRPEALQYKLRIVSRGTYLIDLSHYPIFYGNMKAKKIKKGVISFPQLTITCFNKKLQEQIEKYLPEFFWVTNFGTMQSKGFGGFLPRINNFNEKSLITAFHEADAKAVYKMVFDREGIKVIGRNVEVSSSVKMFEEIKKYYGILKSGQNFKGYAHSYVYKYIREKFNIGNEKAWMKKNGISPNVITKSNINKKEVQDDLNPKYVRALLGKGDTITYHVDNDDVQVSINPAKIQNDSLERIPSPLLFKVIGKSVYVLARDVPTKVYNQEFIFDGYKEGKLKTPSIDDFSDYGGKFPIEDFLDNYMNYYNGKLRNDIHDMQSFQKVVKCE